MGSAEIFSFRLPSAERLEAVIYRFVNVGFLRSDTTFVFWVTHVTHSTAECGILSRGGEQQRLVSLTVFAKQLSRSLEVLYPLFHGFMWHSG